MSSGQHNKVNTIFEEHGKLLVLLDKQNDKISAFDKMLQTTQSSKSELDEIKETLLSWLSENGELRRIVKGISSKVIKALNHESNEERDEIINAMKKSKKKQRKIKTLQSNDVLQVYDVINLKKKLKDFERIGDSILKQFDILKEQYETEMSTVVIDSVKILAEKEFYHDEALKKKDLTIRTLTDDKEKLQKEFENQGKTYENKLDMMFRKHQTEMSTTSSNMAANEKEIEIVRKQNAELTKLLELKQRALKEQKEKCEKELLKKLEKQNRREKHLSEQIDEIKVLKKENQNLLSQVKQLEVDIEIKNTNILHFKTELEGNKIRKKNNINDIKHLPEKTALVEKVEQLTKTDREKERIISTALEMLKILIEKLHAKKVKQVTHIKIETVLRTLSPVTSMMKNFR